MRRSFEQAFVDLRQHLVSATQDGARPGIAIFVYPPEWEPRMLARFPRFAEDCARDIPLELVDLGQGFLVQMERRNGLEERLAAVEQQSPERVLHDLGEIARHYLTRLLATPLAPTATARLLVNAGALGAFVSYSAITNAFHGDGLASSVAAPTVLAFPGEADERELNLLLLRVDTNYRVQRI